MLNLENHITSFTGIVYSDFTNIKPNQVIEVFTQSSNASCISAYVLVKQVLLNQDHGMDDYSFNVVTVLGLDVTSFII